LVQAHPQGQNIGLVRSTSTLLASAYSAQLSLPFNAGKQQLWLTLSQPLRVEQGQALLEVPATFDLGARQFLFETRKADLAPSGREVALEFGYSQTGRRVNLHVNGFIRREPGHIQGIAPDVGALARLQAAF
jgi:hypothetical protein